MASYKHKLLRGVLNTLSLPMYWMLPSINHLRSIPETSTMLATLPWGVSFEKISFNLFGADWLYPQGSDKDREMLYIHGGGYVIGSPIHIVRWQLK